MIVVSEETGAISVVMGGEMVRGLDAPRLRVALRDVLARGRRRARRAGGGAPRRRAPTARRPTRPRRTRSGRADMFRNLRYKVLALVAAFGLWGVAHSTSSMERGFDIPVVPGNVPEELVITEQSTDAVNIRVRGSNAALRRLSVADLEYPVDLAGAKPGTAEREVDAGGDRTSRAAPRSCAARRPASSSRWSGKSTRAVKVRADLDGEPAPGFVIGEVERGAGSRADRRRAAARCSGSPRC